VARNKCRSESTYKSSCHRRDAPFVTVMDNPLSLPPAGSLDVGSTIAAAGGWESTRQREAIEQQLGAKLERIEAKKRADLSREKIMPISMMNPALRRSSTG
jgi:hypothetical protein